MTHLRTRHALLRLVPILLAALALACATVTEEGAGAAGPETDDLLALLPVDAFVVGWVDFDALRESSSGTTLLDEQSRNADQELQRLTEATGIEMEDMHRAAFAAFRGAEQEDEAVVVAVAKVDYDPERMTRTLAERPQLDYRDRTLYELDESMWNAEGGADVEGDPGSEESAEQAAGDEEQEASEEEDERPFLAMLDAETLLLGNERGVRAGLDTIDGEAGSLRDDVAMVEIIEGASAGSQAWIVVTQDAWAEEIGDLPEQGMPVPRSAIEGMERMTFSLGVEDGFMLRVTGVAANEEDAGLLTDSLQGLLSMGKMMIQQEPEIFAILDEGITVDSDGPEIRLEARLTDAQIEALRRFAEEQMPEEAGGSGS